MSGRVRQMARVGAWAAGTVLLTGLVCEASLYVSNRLAVRRAESLLHQVQGMTIGSTTEADVGSVVARYGGDVSRSMGRTCESFAPRWRAQSVRVESPVLNWIGERDFIHGTHFRQFGPAQWEVTASFAVDDQGRLACVLYGVRATVVRSDAIQLHASLTLPPPSGEATYGSAYRDIHHVQSLGIGASSNTTTEEQRHVFDFNLGCLSRFGGCRTAAEMMPYAWADYLKHQETNTSSSQEAAVRHGP